MKLLKKVSSFLIMFSLCMIVGLCGDVLVANAGVTEDGIVKER